eukprot:TRINITY_DN7321_c0_g1_i1.p1 TRINITY_DN7321_c0_g1~~TRINITY_DN7321_c0_g1_i1.p1  ORF type:complete len:136 (-),score=24.18 TRINITY_DN7321_c0_g1_i1:376-783(-)
MWTQAALLEVQGINLHAICFHDPTTLPHIEILPYKISFCSQSMCSVAAATTTGLCGLLHHVDTGCSARSARNQPSCTCVRCVEEWLDHGSIWHGAQPLLLLKRCIGKGSRYGERVGMEEKVSALCLTLHLDLLIC